MEEGAGRPTEYNEEILVKAKEYILSCEDEEKQVGLQVKLKVKIPTIEGLALFLKINRDTVYDWEKKYPKFSDIIGELRAKQADRLLNNGLSGDYNPTIAKVLLAKHGYRDEQGLVGAEGKNLFEMTDEQAERLLKRKE